MEAAAGAKLVGCRADRRQAANSFFRRRPSNSNKYFLSSTANERRDYQVFANIFYEVPLVIGVSTPYI
jgi:hypothetical protein